MERFKETGNMFLLRLNRGIYIGFLLVVTFVSQGYAQLMMYSTEQRVEFTSAWEGERFPDGRPKVDESILKRMKTVSAEEAWSVIYRGGGFRDHQQNGLKRRCWCRRCNAEVAVERLPTRFDHHLYAPFPHSGQRESRK